LPTTHWPTAHEPYVIAAAARCGRRRRRGAARRVQGAQGLPQYTQGHLAVAALLGLGIDQLVRVVVVQCHNHQQQPPPPPAGPGAAAAAANKAAATGNHLHALAQGDPHQPARLHVHRAEAHRPRQSPRPWRAPLGVGRRRRPAGRVVFVLVRELRQQHPRRGAASLRGLAADAAAAHGPAAGRALHGARHPAAVRARRRSIRPAAALRAEGALRPVPAGGRRRRGDRPSDVDEHEQRRQQRWGRVLPVDGGDSENVFAL